MAALSFTEVYEEGARAWPDVDLDPNRFRAFLQARSQGVANGSNIRATDLFLAGACLDGNANAQRHLEELCRNAFRFARTRVKVTADEDEVVNTLLTQLLVAEPGNSPKLNLYEGRSRLRRWLEVIAGHHLLKLSRGDRFGEPLYEVMLAGIPSSGTREWKEMNKEFRTAFKEALATALKNLGFRDRYLLQLRLDGLRIESIAQLFHVTRFTVMRWLDRASVAVEHAVRRELSDSLGLGSGEIDTLVRSVLSQVDSSIQRQVSTICGCGLK
jgi:RNA polymerase sigma-70 factor